MQLNGEFANVTLNRHDEYEWISFAEFGTDSYKCTIGFSGDYSCSYRASFTQSCFADKYGTASCGTADGFDD